MAEFGACRYFPKRGCFSCECVFEMVWRNQSEVVFAPEARDAVTRR